MSILINKHTKVINHEMPGEIGTLAASLALT